MIAVLGPSGCVDRSELATYIDVGVRLFPFCITFLPKLISMEFFKDADPRFYKAVTFTKTLRHAITPSTDPRTVQLPEDFSVCVIGASGDGIGEHIAYAYAYAGASRITITSRTPSSLKSVAANIKSISPSATVQAHPCDISSFNSVSNLASTISEGLDCVITVPASSPPLSSSILNDSPQEYTDAYLTNTVGCLHVAKCFIPHLLAKPNGAKSFLAIGSLSASLTQGFAAQIAYNISKFAEMRTVEQLSYQFEKEGLLAASIHPGAVLTKLSASHLPEDMWYMLEDEKGLCGATCVWLTKDAEDMRKWLNGRFVSSCWDKDELVARREEILEKNLLKLSMDV